MSPRRLLELAIVPLLDRPCIFDGALHKRPANIWQH